MNRKFYCNDSTVVETVAGKVRGCYCNDSYYFRGIPYADAERYEMPTPVKPWEGILDAVTYGPVAPTVGKPGVKGMGALDQQPLFGYRFWPEDEKCQYINVWTKRLDPNAKRPVMVWIHGGGFANGSSVEQMSYDGHNLCVDGDVVVVSMNHRLNILGYMDFSDFGEKYHNSGNAGMADLVEALKWVKNNIAKFGGDPDNVTLFGQSGGGGKIRTLTQIPAADGLYNRVIFQSGLMNLPLEVEGNEFSRKVAAKMVEKAGYTKESFDEFRKIPFEELRLIYMDVMSDLREAGELKQGVDAIGPVRNDYYLGNPNEVGLSEYAKTVPVMCGTCICETILYDRDRVSYTVSNEKREEMLGELFGDRKEEMIELFNKTYPGRDLLDLYYLDYIVRRGTYQYLDRKAEHAAPLYNYVITYFMDYQNGTPAYHGLCLPLVFGNTEYVDACNEPDLVCLSQKMHQAWMNFATCGDPNGGDVPVWAPYKAGECGTMIFDRQCGMRYNYDRELITKWEEYTDFVPSFMRMKRAK